MTRRDYSPTIENIDIALARCAELIERYPRKEGLWLIFERLEAEREKAISRNDRLAAAKARVKLR